MEETAATYCQGHEAVSVAPRARCQRPPQRIAVPREAAEELGEAGPDERHICAG